MSVLLTDRDARLLSAASEALLSPLLTGSAEPAAWWARVEPVIRDLFPGTNALLARPQAGGLKIVSESADWPGVHTMETMSWSDPHSNRFVFECPVAEAWLKHRRTSGHEVSGETMAERWLADLGHRLDRSMYLHEGLYGARMHGFMALTPTLPDGGEVFLTVGHERKTGARDLEAARLPVLGMLLPALRTGFHTLRTLAARQHALAATLDAVPEALMVVGPDGRDRHRNAALRRRLAEEPERERVAATMLALATELRTMAMRGALRAATRAALPTAGVAHGERRLATPLARYVLRAAYGAEAVWGAPGTVLVSLDLDTPPPASPAMGPLAALTPREAEVARLLARRATNTEVATALGVSPHTARHHAQRVLEKLGLRSRRELGALLGAAPPG
ncbi:MAG: helix-turn-helix transcriptional regulator [Gemmatirosa sp.]